METKVPKLIPFFAEGGPDRRIVQIAVGGTHTLALNEDGKVFSWGCADGGALGRIGADKTPAEVQLPFRASGICAGDNHSIAYNTEANLLYFWGCFRDHQGLTIEPVMFPIRVGEKLLKAKNPLSKVASGKNHVLVLAGKKVFAFGAPGPQIGR